MVVSALDKGKSRESGLELPDQHTLIHARSIY